MSKEEITDSSRRIQTEIESGREVTYSYIQEEETQNCVSLHIFELFSYKIYDRYIN